MKLIPYHTIENKNFKTAEIIITPDIFNKVSYLDGKTTITFENCKFERVVIINKTKINFENILLYFSFSLIQEIEVISMETEQISLHFHGCIVSGNINNSNLKNISFNNCITPSLFLQHLKSVDISYTEENIFILKWKDLIKYTNIESIESLFNLKQAIYINDSKNINIYFNQNKSKKSGVYRSKFETNNDYKVRYYLKKDDKEKLNINLSINCVHDSEAELKIQNCILNSLSLQGSAKGKLKIENAEINNFYIRDFSSELEILLYNISPYKTNSKFEVHKSNMDNVWFDNIDFISYQTLSFYRTRFAKATFTSCNFPDNSLDFQKFMNLKNINYPEQKAQNYYKDQYETFLQLRKSLESTGNYFEAQKLEAISKDSLRKISSLPTYDKLILYLNNVSNNHGLSIERPFIWLLIFSVIFYILYLTSIDRFFVCTEFDWNLVGYYFSFIDITHRTDFLVSKGELNGFSLIIDYLNKVVIGFLIYQFISAFRKYGKR